MQWADITCLELPKVYKLVHLDLDDRQLLAKTYSCMYPGQGIGVDAIGMTPRRYTSVTLACEKFGSKLERRSLRSARVMVSWAGEEGEVNSTATIRPGQIRFYILHNIKNGDSSTIHMSLHTCMQLYTEDVQKELYRRPVEIWKLKEFDNPGAASFLPVRRVFCKLAAVEKTRTGKLVISQFCEYFVGDLLSTLCLLICSYLVCLTGSSHGLATRPYSFVRYFFTAEAQTSLSFSSDFVELQL